MSIKKLRYLCEAAEDKYRIVPATPTRICTVEDLTWGPMGAQCLNCKSESHSIHDFKHSPQPGEVTPPTPAPETPEPIEPNPNPPVE